MRDKGDYNMVMELIRWRRFIEVRCSIEYTFSHESEYLTYRLQASSVAQNFHIRKNE